MTTTSSMQMCLDPWRSLKWDPVKEEFIGDDEVNRLGSCASRLAWLV